MTFVLHYGARPAGDDVRDQMRKGRAYYNALVEAENLRRQTVWGGPKPPAPPHDDCDCAACQTHWTNLRDALYKTPPIDVKPLRAAAIADGLYWGTYLVVEQAFAAAWKKTHAFKTVRFRSYREGGVIAVQIQASNRKDRFYRVTKQHDPRKGRRAKRGGRHTVEIRIGSDANRRPVFCTPIRIELHRPIDGRVTWVHINQKFVADREVWSVDFTCTDDLIKGPLYGHAVAVDVGWRQLDGGSWRLAYARDAAGNVDTLCLPATWAERSARADRIRAHRDDRLNALKKQDARFARVKSCLGVVRKVRRDGITDPAVLAWLQRDRHLWQYECGCRRRSAAARRAQLVEWVAALRKRYADVIVKDTRHKQLKEKKELPQAARRQGQHGAPGETVETLRRFFGDDHVHIVKAMNTTATCPSCAAVSDYGGELMITCEGCGAVADRDDVSTQNMWTLYRKGATKQPTARKRTARFAKRHQKPTAASQC